MNHHKEVFQLKKIVLTGAAKGIGRALALKLGKSMEIFALDYDEVALKDLSKQLPEAQFHYFVGDLAKEEDLASFVAWIKQEAHFIDGLIHNAAIDRGGLLNQASYQDFMQTLQVNVGAAYYLVLHLQSIFHSEMSIILLSSTRNHQSMPNNETYVSSKGAILSLTHALANSLRTKARVNAISPGWIETAPFQFPKKEVALSATDHAQQLVGRVGEPEDIYQLVDFLLDSQKSGFITGQEIVIDGGMSKQMIYHDEFGWRYNQN